MRHTEVAHSQSRHMSEAKVFEDGLAGLLRHLRNDVPADILNKHLIVRAQYLVEWVGRRIESVEQWHTMARETDQEALRTMMEFERRLNSRVSKPQSIRRRRRFAEDNGDEVDFDRLRAGQPYWSTAKRVAAPGPKTVTLLVNPSSNCDVDSKQILWKAVAGIVAAKLLEEAGYRVEIWLYHSAVNAYTDRTGYQMLARLKRSGEPLNYSALATACAGWFYRTGLFACEAYSPVGRKGRDNLGSAVTGTIEDAKRILPNLTGPAYVVNCKGEYDAEQWVNNVLSHFGVGGR